MTPIPLTPPDPITPEALADLAKSCHADSVAAGWWEPLEPAADTAREAMRADLIGSEVGEALDALRRPERPLAYVTAEGKPDGYLVEVADTAIRALDLLGRMSSSVPPDEVLASVYAGLHLYGRWKQADRRRSRPSPWQHRVWWVLVEDTLSTDDVVHVVYLCNAEAAAHGADLVTLINLKRAFNRTRGTRHGGMSV